MFNWLKLAYPLNLATLGQCKLAVEKNKITELEFKIITGEDYMK
jgi:hypothetical protein